MPHRDSNVRSIGAYRQRTSVHLSILDLLSGYLAIESPPEAINTRLALGSMAHATSPLIRLDVHPAEPSAVRQDPTPKETLGNAYLGVGKGSKSLSGDLFTVVHPAAISVA